MRKYRVTDEDRWKEILALVRWQLELRTYDALRWERRTGEVSALNLKLLRKAYNDSRFLHRFLGYSKETKAEKTAAGILARAGEPPE